MASGKDAEDLESLNGMRSGKATWLDEIPNEALQKLVKMFPTPNNVKILKRMEGGQSDTGIEGKKAGKPVFFGPISLLNEANCVKQ
ncbi:hypothetical protein QE152_g22368 [Popillia japonica]|uniref:Uncharacterized protein n=1 Tax=Popillia japonica TaxID=7064 RepID=A0AAW1KMD3_POPJA